MTRFRLIGAAAVLFSVLAGPVMARHVISSPGRPAQSIFCATREAGNPHSKYCDYLAPGANGDSAAVGTVASITLACLTPAIYRENAALMSGAKYYLGRTHEVIIRPVLRRARLLDQDDE